MPLIIYITDEVEVFTNRFTAPFAVDVTRKMDAEQALFAADIKSGDGTIVFVDAVSDVFEAAR